METANIPDVAFDKAALAVFHFFLSNWNKQIKFGSGFPVQTETSILSWTKF